MSGDALIVQEVATRDGFQIEPVFVPTAEKIRLIDALAEAGFRRIEVSSFVSPKAVPALADAAEVFSGIRRRPGTVYVALVPNPKGAERALAMVPPLICLLSVNCFLKGSRPRLKSWEGYIF